MKIIRQSTASNVMVLMTASADHVIGIDGLTLTIELSKDGGAFALINPTVTGRGDGWYNIALTASHTDTLGDLVLHIDGGVTADPTDVLMSVSDIRTSIDALSQAVTDLSTTTNAISVLVTDVSQAITDLSNTTDDISILVDTLSQTTDDVSILVEELHLLEGLKLGSPMTVTPTTRVVGGISLEISGDGETSTTVERV
jgi:hypothetical protein